MVVTDLVMVNRACARIGARPLGSMSETTQGGEAAQLTYDSTLEKMLGMHPFSFARVFRQLSRDTDAPPFSGFTWRYSLPADRLGPPIKVRESLTDEDDRFSAYIINADKLHTNAETLFAEILFPAEPHLWSGPFREAFVLALAAELAMTLHHDAKLRAELMTAAFGNSNEGMRGGVFGAAIRADSFATPSKKLRHGSNPMTAHYRDG